MRVLILADALFATRERSMLSRLEVGLADEGVRVVHAVPAGLEKGIEGAVFTRVVTYDDRWWRVGLGAAARDISRGLRDMDEWEGVDVVHAFGGSSWSLAAALAREFAGVLVVEAWRARLGDAVRKLAARARVPVLALAPDAAIEREIGAEADGVTIRLAPWGVHAAESVRDVLPAGRAPSAMLVGTGRDARSYHAAMAGLAGALATHPDLIVVCDALAARRAGLWALAKGLGVRDRLSLVADLEARRELVLQGDLLIIPAANGEQRTIALDAMAQGMVVVAAGDPMVSSLIDDETARLVQSRTRDAWCDAVLSLLADPRRAQGLASRAHAFVRAKRRASDQVRAVMEAYAWMVGKDAIPIGGTRERSGA